VGFTVMPVTEVPPWELSPLKYVYVQLADHLAARIDAGEWQPGDRLPPERDLAGEYGVAYHSVRRAMGILRDRGYVVSLHGRGTYAADRRA
jgi:DNA-binding GntR family transcriptional regulator